jgi:hypothetical protein
MGNEVKVKVLKIIKPANFFLLKVGCLATI